MVILPMYKQQVGVNMVTMEDLDSRVKALESAKETSQLDRIEQKVDGLSNLISTRLGHAESLTVFDALEALTEGLTRVENKLL